MSDGGAASLRRLPWMLSIFGAPIGKGPRPSLNSQSFCVAPSAVFSDYDRVIAGLRSEQETMNKELEFIPETTGDFFLASEQLPESSGKFERCERGCDGLTFDYDSMLAPDEEFHERLRPRVHSTHPAIDISNTYAAQKRSLVRKSRRPKPYECRQDDTSVDLSTRCPYVNPEDGTSCGKINKTPQERSRHWRSCHLYKEAKEMLTGVLPVGQGTAITSEAQLEEIIPHIQCSLCKALITRSDAMRRHLKTNCRAFGGVETFQNDGLHRKAMKRLT